MILRRFIDHFRRQEWTAIFLDFLVVVGGVFVGLQVNNWNAARAARHSERVFLAAVRDDIRQDADDTRGYMNTFSVVTKSGERALATLDEPAPCGGDCWERVAEFFLASQWLNLRSDRATFDEIRRTGLPHDRALRTKLTRYYGLGEQMVPITMELPAFRALVRSSVPYAVQEYFWSTCFRAEGRQQYFDENCRAPIGDDAARAIVEKLKADPLTRPTLNYWLSTVSVVETTLGVQVAAAEDMIDTLDAYLRAQK
jgi:hypothetical protein